VCDFRASWPENVHRRGLLFLIIADSFWRTLACTLCLTALPWVAHGSGCFGGFPEVYPTDGVKGVPANVQVRITHRVFAASQWMDSNGAKVLHRARWVGQGHSRAKVLEPAAPLPEGTYEIDTVEPEERYRFRVDAFVDQSRPAWSGELELEGVHAPQPGSSCPDNTWIRATFALPRDEATPPDGFAYLIRIGPVPLDDAQGDPWESANLLVHAERILLAERVGQIRIGESGCGCLPYWNFEPGARYQVELRAVDWAGNLGDDVLTGKVTIPLEADAIEM
jgi:hypothetical protein